MNLLDSSKMVKVLTPIALEINSVASLLASQNELDPISLKIILDANVYVKPFIFILAVTRLRFSDARDLFLSNAFLQESIVLQQNKTKHFVKVDLSVIPPFLRYNLFSLNHWSEITDYHKIYSYLKFFKQHFLKDLTLDFNSNSHIFRHLNSSFLRAFDCDKDYISKKLGHLDKSAQSSYIHSELVSIFSKLL